MCHMEAINQHRSFSHLYILISPNKKTKLQLWILLFFHNTKAPECTSALFTVISLQGRWYIQLNILYILAIVSRTMFILWRALALLCKSGDRCETKTENDKMCVSFVVVLVVVVVVVFLFISIQCQGGEGEEEGGGCKFDRIHFSLGQANNEVNEIENCILNLSTCANTTGAH